MSRQHVDHADIVKFAQERVNLPKEKANEYRAQARRLRWTLLFGQRWGGVKRESRRGSVRRSAAKRVERLLRLPSLFH